MYSIEFNNAERECTMEFETHNEALAYAVFNYTCCQWVIVKKEDR